MKKVLVLIILSVILLFPIFKSGFYISHDGFAHVARFAAYYKAFSDGQIIPRWAGDLNAGYGTPLFIFFYPLPGYLASLIHIFGIDFETVFKLLMFLGFTLSSITFYLWLRKLSNNENLSFASSIIFMVMPYRLLDTFVRGDVAEITSFIFIPLVFMFIDKVQKQKNLRDIVLGGLFYGLLIISHNAIAFIFSPIFLLYAFFFKKRMKDFLHSSYVLILGILLSSFFWIPSIVENKYVYGKLFVENIYKDNFVSLINLIYSPWGFGPDVNKPGGLSPQIGILYIGLPLLFIVFIFLKRIRGKIKIEKTYTFWLVILILSIFMTTGYSKIFWEKLPLIKSMGYPWRFTALSGFASCMLIFYLLKFIGNRFVLYIIALLFFITSIPFVKVNGYVNKKSDSFYYSYQGTTDYHMRTTTIWSKGDFAVKAKNQIELIGGKAEINNLQKKETAHTFNLMAATSAQILDNTVYFPGWKVKANGKEIPIEFQDMNHRGLITFRVPRGNYKVIIQFSDTKDRFFSNLISLIALVFSFIILSFHTRLRFR